MQSKTACVGISLFSHIVANALSSAPLSLTSVFGMGTGGPSASSTPTILVVSYVLLLQAFTLEENRQQTQTFWKRHFKHITCSSTVFGSLPSVIKKQIINYYLFIIHYSFFIEPCASKAVLVTRGGIEPPLPA